MKRIFVLILTAIMIFSPPTIAKVGTATKIVAAYVVYKIITKDKKEENADAQAKMQQSSSYGYECEDEDGEELEECEE